MFSRLMDKLGYIKKSQVNEALDFATNISKRLDEHRETVLAIQEKTNLFTSGECHITHMATQDDYLMRLFYVRHGEFPPSSRSELLHGPVRERPDILGVCLLPEYKLSVKNQ